MPNNIQKLKLVDRRFPALMAGEKTDTIRWNEGVVETGLLLYEGCDDLSLQTTVWVTDVLFIPLRKVSEEVGSGESLEYILSSIRVHYPDITLDTEIMLVKHLTPAETEKLYNQDAKELNAFSFGDSPEMADELLDLVLNGIKTATCSALEGYKDESLPQIGDQSIVLDSQGKPRCIIEIATIEINRFCDVDSDFAYKEGEADKSLEYWQAEHQNFFERTNIFDPEMELVCEEFKLVRVL